MGLPMAMTVAQSSMLAGQAFTQEHLYEKCNGIIGVPITFLDKFCPGQYEVVGCTANPQGNKVLKQQFSEEATNLYTTTQAKKCKGNWWQ